MPGISKQMMYARQRAMDKIYEKEREEEKPMIVDITLTVEGEMTEQQDEALTERIQSALHEIDPKLSEVALEKREGNYVLSQVKRMMTTDYIKLCYLAGHRATGVIDGGLQSVTLNEICDGKTTYSKRLTPYDLKRDLKANVMVRP